jgi:YggT family protein
MAEFLIRLLGFFDWLIGLVIFIIFVSAILSWLIAFNVVNRYNTVVFTIAESLNRMTEPLLRPIRRRLGYYNSVDLSPLVLIIILYFISWVIIPTLAHAIR